jgi:hypothetical protein
LIDVMVLVFVGFILGAASYTAYSYVWQRRCRAEFRWLNLTSMLLSLIVDVAASPLLNIPGAVPLVLRGLGSGYILLSSFAFSIMVNFFVAKPLSYFCHKSAFMVGRGRTAAEGFWKRRAANVSNQLQKPVTWKLRRLWLVIFALAIFLPASFTLASLQYQATISTHGTIKAVGVAFYNDSLGVNAASQINWGTLEPGQTVNVTLYMKSTSNVAVTCSMAVGNFNPPIGSNYLACTWNYSGSLSPSQLVPVVFTLVAANTITGIAAFSFDISVVGTSG